jgi:hypothetical protein
MESPPLDILQTQQDPAYRVSIIAIHSFIASDGRAHLRLEADHGERRGRKLTYWLKQADKEVPILAVWINSDSFRLDVRDRD